MEEGKRRVLNHGRTSDSVVEGSERVRSDGGEF